MKRKQSSETVFSQCVFRVSHMQLFQNQSFWVSCVLFMCLQWIGPKLAMGRHLFQEKLNFHPSPSFK